MLRQLLLLFPEWYKYAGKRSQVTSTLRASRRLWVSVRNGMSQLRPSRGFLLRTSPPAPVDCQRPVPSPGGSRSSILSNTATRTDESALKKWKGRTSLVAQWVRTCLPTRGTWVWSLVRGKIPCATGHLSPGAPTAEPALQQGEPWQWGTSHQTRSRPARSTGDPARQEINNEWASF